MRTSDTRDLARRVVAAGIAAAISVGGVAGAVLPAMAATGKVTITQRSNAGARYDGYRVFRANVDAQDRATDVTWESDAIKAATLAYLDTQGYAAWLTANGHTAAVNGVSAHDIAQNAAGFISEMVQSSATDEQAATTPRTTKGSSFANGLARALVAAGIAPATPTSGQATGSAFTGEQGYYLFVTHSETEGNTIGTGEAGTAPIWVAVGATAKSIAGKESVPAISAKQSLEDSTGAYGLAADANRMQSVSYRLTGTVAANANAFERYHYEFDDAMTGLEMSTSELSALTVKIDGTDVTSKVKSQSGSSITFSGGSLKVVIADLLSLGQTIKADTTVVVDYQAHLNASAVTGSTGNANTVSLTYSSNPSITDELTGSPSVTIKTYAYALEVAKVDQDTREALSGAKFTIQVASDSSDAASRGKYVQADGSLGTTAHSFVTDSSGKFSVAGIDEGTYIIHEVAAPAEHKLLAADAKLVVSRTFDASGALTGLSATISGGNGLFATSPAAHQDGVTAAEVSSGKVGARISDKRETYLPGTGLTTTSAGIAVGLTLVAGGLVGLTRMRKGGRDEA